MIFAHTQNTLKNEFSSVTKYFPKWIHYLCRDFPSKYPCITASGEKIQWDVILRELNYTC